MQDYAPQLLLFSTDTKVEHPEELSGSKSHFLQNNLYEYKKL